MARRHQDDERDRSRHRGGRAGGRSGSRDVRTGIRSGHRNDGRSRSPRRAHVGLLLRSRERRSRRISSNSSAPTACGVPARMADRLAEMGKPIDREKLLAPRRARAIAWTADGRARRWSKPAMSQTCRQAFDQLIGEGKPAFVPRAGPRTCRRDRHHQPTAGGIASLAHPGLLRRDDLIPGMVEAGLRLSRRFTAITIRRRREHYLALAERLRHRGVRRLRLSRRKRTAPGRIWNRRTAAGAIRAARGAGGKKEN